MCVQCVHIHRTDMLPNIDFKSHNLELGIIIEAN